MEYKNDKLISENDSTQLKQKQQKLLDSIKPLNDDRKIEIESSYNGGDSSWQKYLFKNFHFPDRAINNEIQGTVIVEFIVSNEGKVENAFIDRSVEYSLDKEALRIINGSNNNWIPAFQNGRKVKSYKRQPIVYRLQIQK